MRSLRLCPRVSHHGEGDVRRAFLCVRAPVHEPSACAPARLRPFSGANIAQVRPSACSLPAWMAAQLERVPPGTPKPPAACEGLGLPSVSSRLYAAFQELGNGFSPVSLRKPESMAGGEGRR